MSEGAAVLLFAYVLMVHCRGVLLTAAVLCIVLQWDEEHINWNFDVRKGPINVEWYKGGTTNICYNALDRHVAAGETRSRTGFAGAKCQCCRFPGSLAGCASAYLISKGTR